MNSNETWPNARRISSRISIHNSRACNCNFCFDPATVKRMSTSRDRTPPGSPAQSNGGRDEVDRHDVGIEGLHNPDSNPLNTGKTVDIQLKSGSNKRLSLSMQLSDDDSDNSGSRKVKSCPSTPDNVEATLLTFNRSKTKSTQEIVRTHKFIPYNPGNNLDVDNKPAEPRTARTLWDSISLALWNTKSFLGVGVLLVAFYAIWLMPVSGNTSDEYDPQIFSDDLNRLGEDYKLTKESLLSFEAGLQFIKKEKSTACIILSYGEKYRVPSEDSHFIERLSSAAAKYLRNSTRANPIILDRDELSIEDQEYLQANYRHALEDRSVMAVKHLESLPARTALAFHYFCDEYYPLVKNTAIILLFDNRKCDAGNTNDVQTNALQHVERCLTRQWSQIDNDELKPLLTRVINVVIDLDKV